MTLRRILITQTIIVLLGTVLFTLCTVPLVCAVCGLQFVPGRLGENPFGLSRELYVIMLEDGVPEVVSNEPSGADVSMVRMALSSGEQTVKLNGSTYIITKERPSRFVSGTSEVGAGEREVILITPVINLNDYTKKVMIITLGCLSVGVLISGLCAANYSRKRITEPLRRLKSATDKITDGNLDTEVGTAGSGEIAALYDSVEKLRINLRDSVSAREKYDENRKFLISGISHDLRTPVTAIRGYIEGVLDGVADTKEKKEIYLKNAISKTETVRILIEDLLLYSKLDLGQVPFEMEEVYVDEYLKNVTEDFAEDYARQDRRLFYSGGIDKNLKIRIDRTRFSRILQNIFDNSAKNTEAGIGTIEVKARANASSVVIEVADNGRGLPKDKLTKVFDRFYRGEASRKNDGGSGLGLTIAKQMAEGMGGRIWATGDEGKGLSVLISFGFVK